ncbi:MAG: hypothetical protein HY254_01390 [Burkholderiales bacterium]|nr:hypothetical protein [Burkholderiales bacterium]
MQVQKHARIASIRKLSKYFIYLAVLSMIFIVLGTLLFPFVLAKIPSGDLTIAGYLAKAATVDDGLSSLLASGISTQLKIAAAMAAFFFSALLFMIIGHLKNLITCFYKGEIFNRQAVFHAKKAFNLKLLLVSAKLVLDFLCLIFSYFYPGSNSRGDIGPFIGGVLDQLALIAFFLLLIWSLEIGVDLNEEAELTI